MTKVRKSASIAFYIHGEHPRCGSFWRMIRSGTAMNVPPIN
uniref:Uncharacterized protein n=1 Tax=Klebsiella pneumoniae TaxID=573 RepID=A0A8B0SW69_KLEPN|nr:hypothetical protein [Klebsiella pneumoniae]